MNRLSHTTCNSRDEKYSTATGVNLISLAPGAIPSVADSEEVDAPAFCLSTNDLIFSALSTALLALAFHFSFCPSLGDDRLRCKYALADLIYNRKAVS